MFQTHWHVWLQAFFDAAWMVPLMTFVSTLGYEWAYVLLIVVLSFGVRLRAGLGVMLAVLLMSTATHAIKQSAAAPPQRCRHPRAGQGPPWPRAGGRWRCRVVLVAAQR